MKRFLALTKAMTLMHLRNRPTLFWNLVFPLFILLIYSQVFGRMSVGGVGFMAWVLPGVELVLAIFLLLTSTFIRDDFPTLDLPAKAISGLSGGG